MSYHLIIPKIGVKKFMKQLRKIPTNQKSVSGYVSYRGEPIAFESTLGRDFLIYQSFRDNVIDIMPQPISIPFKKNGRTCNYTPDYFVQVKLDCGKSLLVDIKPKKEWQENWREHSNKWRSAIAFCKEQCFRFSIYDEDRIYHYAFDNLRFLSMYKNIAVSEDEVKAIIEDIRLRGFTTVEYILERYFKSELYRQHGRRLMWYLMINKLIKFDIWSDVRSEKLEVWFDFLPSLK